MMRAKQRLVILSLIRDSYINEFEKWSRERFDKRFSPSKALLEHRLGESVHYSFFSGGKRFRPLLCFGVAEAEAISIERMMPFSLAVEMIHTYSLIHDDLPCMDDDLERRGQPTNHVVFGEALALLAGDALLTEAFHVLVSEYANEPKLAVDLVKILSEASGCRGMVGGQVRDLGFRTKAAMSDAELKEMHEMKTGALISASVVGAARIANVDVNKLSLFKKLGDLIGVAFQLADDLLDASDKLESGNRLKLINRELALKDLSDLSGEAERILSALSPGAKLLRDLIQENLRRAT